MIEIFVTLRWLPYAIAVTTTVLAGSTIVFHFYQRSRGRAGPLQNRRLAGGLMAVPASVFAIFVWEYTRQAVLQAQISQVANDRGTVVRQPFDRIGDERRFLKDLAAVHSVLPHHSHPTESVEVDLVGRGRDIRLVLRRDSANESEYWVYWPARGGGEVGRIFTSEIEAIAGADP